MSFREKSAWITFLTVLIVFGAYYLSIHMGLIPSRGWEHFRVLVGCIGLVIVLQIALHIVAAVLNPQDARSPKDERERAIQHHAHTYGYYVLTLGVFGLFPIGHMHAGAPYLLHWAFFSVIAATLATALTQIILYRRNS